MKRLSAIALCFLMLFSLCACGDKDVEEPPVEEVVPEVVVTEDLVLRGEFLSEYTEIDAPDINKFLGTAIVNVRPEEYRKNDIPIISENSPDANLYFTLMYLKPEYLDSYAFVTSESNTRAYTIAIMKAKPNCEEYLVNAINMRIADLYEDVKDYPDQLYLLENHIINQVGDYLVFVVCDNADDVFNTIANVMANTDLTTIEPVPYMTDEERSEIEKAVLTKELNSLEDSIGDVIVTPVEAPEYIENPEDSGIDLPVEEIVTNN